MTTRLKSLKDASDDVLECRSMGHAWRHYNDEALKANGCARRWEECMRCGSQRYRDIDFLNAVFIRRGMRYTDNYLMPTGSPRLSRADVLVMSYTRKREEIVNVS